VNGAWQQLEACWTTSGAPRSPGVAGVAVEEGRQVAGVAVEEGRQVAGVAVVEEGRQVAGVAVVEEGRQVAGVAVVEEGREVAGVAAEEEGREVAGVAAEEEGREVAGVAAEEEGREVAGVALGRLPCPSLGQSELGPGREGQAWLGGRLLGPFGEEKGEIGLWVAKVCSPLQSKNDRSTLAISGV